MKKLVIILSVFVLMFGLLCTTAQASPAVRVVVDGKTIAFTDAKPYVDSSNRTQVPMRALGEALGCQVNYYKEKDNNGFFDTRIELSKSTADGKVWKTTFFGPYKTIYDSYDGWLKNFDVNVETAVVEYPNTYKQVTMDTAPTMINARTYLPARYVAEAFGYSVKWDGKNNTVIINTDPDTIFNQKPYAVPHIAINGILGNWSLQNNKTKETANIEITENAVIYKVNNKSYSYNITNLIFDQNTASYSLSLQRGNVSTLLNLIIYGYGDQAICFHRLEPNFEFFGDSSFAAYYISQTDD